MKTLTQTIDLLESKKISSLEITQECLAKTNAGNNSFISVLSDLSLEDAKKSDERRSQNKVYSRLDGIPYSLKDLFVTKNIRTTAGSKILYNYIPPFDGHVAQKFKEAGSILVGKVGCDEFGMGSTNECTPYGAVLNPLNKAFVAGGSSGGSAASVAEGSSYFSIGTDTGGSVRLPANFCGLVGFKPSYGRVSRFGQIAYGSSLDQASPMARSVSDISLLMEILSVKDSKDSTQATHSLMKTFENLKKINPDFIKNKKIGFDPSFIDSCSSEIKKSLQLALDNFSKMGAHISEVSLPHLKHCVSVYYIIATAEASANLARYDGIHYGFRAKKEGANLLDTYRDSRTEGFGDEVKKRILLGTYSLSSGYQDEYFAKACKVRRLIFNDFQNAFKNVDILFSPVCATSAFELGKGAMDPIQMYMNDLYTIPVNLAGLPAIALPFGQDQNQMPTGFQLIGNYFKDESVLEFARAFEMQVSKE